MRGGRTALGKRFSVLGVLCELFKSSEGFFFFSGCWIGISCLTVAVLADCSHTLRGETGCVPTALHL